MGPTRVQIPQIHALCRAGSKKRKPPLHLRQILLQAALNPNDLYKSLRSWRHSTATDVQVTFWLCVCATTNLCKDSSSHQILQWVPNWSTIRAMTNNGQRKDTRLNRSGDTYNYMGTSAGLRALSSKMGRDVSKHEWSMPWDVVAVPAVFETQRFLGDSVKFIFAEEGLFVDDEDVGQHRGKLHCVSSFFAFSRASKPALACKLNADTQMPTIPNRRELAGFSLHRNPLGGNASLHVFGTASSCGRSTRTCWH